jgi:hypothetical protein
MPRKATKKVKSVEKPVATIVDDTVMRRVRRVYRLLSDRPELLAVARRLRPTYRPIRQRIRETSRTQPTAWGADNG